jgi:hypothetical protein
MRIAASYHRTGGGRSASRRSRGERCDPRQVARLRGFVGGPGTRRGMSAPIVPAEPRSSLSGARLSAICIGLTLVGVDVRFPHQMNSVAPEVG